MLVHRAVYAFLHDFAQQALAKLLFQQRHGHLALAKALHFHIGLRLGQLFIDLVVQLCGCDGDGIAALQTFVQRLGDLHVSTFHNGLGRPPGRPRNLRLTSGRAGLVQP